MKIDTMDDHNSDPSYIEELSTSVSSPTDDEDFEDKRSIKTAAYRKRLQRLKNPEFRERERQRNLERTRKLRADPVFRDKERLRNRMCKRKARQNPDYREAEKLRNKLQKRKARENPAYREAERKRNLWQKRRLREDPMYRLREKIKLLERTRRNASSWNVPSEEWMEIGAVNIDSEAKVAFEHGLYHFIDSDNPLPESFKYKSDNSKNLSPEEVFSSLSPLGKDLFSKLFISSLDANSLSDSSSSNGKFIQIVYDHYTKLEITKVSGQQRLKENDSNQNNVINGVKDLMDLVLSRHFLDSGEVNYSENCVNDDLRSLDREDGALHE